MTLRGIPVSPGIVIGKALRFAPSVVEVQRRVVAPAAVEDEVKRLQHAKEQAGRELQSIYNRLRREDPDKAAIFTAQIDLLTDPVVDEELQELIRHQRRNAEWVVDDVYGRYIRVLSVTEDGLIRQRAADLQDVRHRLIRCCMGLSERTLAKLGRPVVVVAKDLLPSDTALLDRENVKAIVTESGGTTSHTAILAKSYNIPALMGVAGAMDLVTEGEKLVVDAVDGVLMYRAEPEALKEYAQRAERYSQDAAEARQYMNVTPCTRDGVRMQVELNVASASADELAAGAYTDGVGLFRTEFLFMGRGTLPDEQEQLEVYRRVLAAFPGRPVILRTLDVGGDKPLTSIRMPAEDNPLLGNRALRFCFSHPEVFHCQLRAALRAAAEGDLWLMFPMVTGLDEIKQAKQAVAKAAASLRKDGLPYNENLPLGVMIETPALAMIPDLVAREVDFASVGTNDLCQYTLAADRQNPLVAVRYQTLHPAMLRLLRNVTEHFAAAGKHLGVCGEMAGDAVALPLLVGFGIRHFSMGMGALGRCKRLLSRLTVPDAERLAQAACNMGTAAEVEAYLMRELAGLL